MPCASGVQQKFSLCRSYVDVMQRIGLDREGRSKPTMPEGAVTKAGEAPDKLLNAVVYGVFGNSVLAYPVGYRSSLDSSLPF